MIGQTLLLALDFWMHTPDKYAVYKSKPTVVTKDGLLANADWVYRQATLANAFTGANTSSSTTGQVPAMTDALAAFGWNAGKRRPTKSGADNAWWIMDDPREEDEATILAALHTKYNSPWPKTSCSSRSVNIKAITTRANSIQPTPNTATMSSPSHRSNYGVGCVDVI